MYGITIKSIVRGCATDRFFTDIILNSDLDAGDLPTIIFFVASFISLATGTSFGTMSIMFPLVSFATFEKSEGDIELFTIALSSIMAGAVFGDHCSLISDTTTLASIGAGCSIGSHVYTQFPYAVWVALFAMLLGTLPAGYGANVAAMLIIGGVILAICTIMIGAPIVAESGRLDLFSEVLARFAGFSGLAEMRTNTQVFARENTELIDPEPYDWCRSCLACLPGMTAAVPVDYDKEKEVEEAVAVEAEKVEEQAPVPAEVKPDGGTAPISPMDV